MIADAIRRISGRESLSREEARALMGEVLAGRATDAEISALLVALHMKGESVEEIVGFAEAMRAAATPLPFASTAGNDVLVDTCGTGGAPFCAVRWSALLGQGA